MRFASMVSDNGFRLHVRGRSGYVDVANATANPAFSSLQAVLEGGPSALARIRELIDEQGVDHDDSQFGPAVPSPPRILCLGVNYLEHAIEGGRKPPTWPECFVRGADSVAAPFGDLVKPALCERFDYEGELGVVIGHGGRYIRAEDALEAIAGYVVLNDATAREWQRAATQWTPGKNFDGTMPVGPEMVTADEVDAADVLLQTRLNGEVMQSARTSQMIVNIPDAIEYLSSFTTLRTGDVIATGTPGGVGFARTPPVWLAPGDLIEVSVEGVGTIRNRVTAESAEAGLPGWKWHAPLPQGASL